MKDGDSMEFSSDVMFSFWGRKGHQLAPPGLNMPHLYASQLP
jgi:hypothetical protein